MRRHVTVECDVDIDVLDALLELDDDALAMARKIVNEELDDEEDCSGDPSHQDLARRLARAIEQGDGKAAADHAHRLCMDLAGVPVLREIHIGRAPWERAA